MKWLKNIFWVLLLIPHLNYAEIQQENLIGCVLKPNKQVKVSSQLNGIVTQMKVKKGDYVKTNQILAVLGASQEQARLKTALAKASYARRKLARYSSITNSDIASKHEIDEMKTELNVSRLEVNEIRTLIKLKTIRSPIAGYITEAKVSEGEYINNAPIVSIADIDFLYADMVLRENIFGQFKIGDDINLTILPPINQHKPAKIKQIDKVIDAASGTFGIRAYFKNTTHSIPAGVDCSVGKIKDIQ